MSWILRVTLGFLVVIGLSWAAEPCPGGWPPRSAAGSVAWNVQRPAAAQQSCHPSVCQIKVLDKDGRHSVGSGTLTWKDGTYGVVMSCEHVFRDTQSPADILVSFPNGKSFRSNLVTTDPTTELAAVVIASPPGIDPVEVAEGDAELGEVVKTVGRCRAIAGRVLSPRGGWMVVSGQAVGGDSGGPILNAAGKLLGVLWGTTQNTITGSSCKRVRAFLCDPRRKILPWHRRGQPCPVGPTAPALPTPPAPDQPQITPPACDLSEIHAQLAELRVLIEGIERGPQGEPGLPGADGAKGEPGEDGESPTLDYKAIADKVVPLLPVLTFQIQDAAGNVMRDAAGELLEFSAGPDGIVPFKFTPVGK